MLYTKKLPSALAKPGIAEFKPFTVIGCWSVNPCVPEVVTVIKEEPKFPVFIEASVVTERTLRSVQGIS